METKQLIGSQLENIKQQLKANQAGLWTALPGVIVDFDPANCTATVQPAIQGIKFTAAKSSSVNLPLLVDCPVVFPRGANCTITFPVVKGLSCLVIFSSRCIDGWWQAGPTDSNGNVATAPQLEMRMHDLSDGYVILGPFAQPEVIANIDIEKLEIRSNDNATKISLDPTGTINVIATTINLTGDVIIDGTLTANGHILDERHT